MHRSTFFRGAFRRTCPQAIETITANGTVLTGPNVNFDSPLLTVSGQTIRHDQANPFTMTPAAVITGIDASIYNMGQVELDQNSTISIPTNTRDAEYLTYLFVQGLGGPYTVTWPGGAEGFRFAVVSTPYAVTAAQVANALAICPVDGMVRVGFQKTTFSGETTWDCTALAGPY